MVDVSSEGSWEQFLPNFTSTKELLADLDQTLFKQRQDEETKFLEESEELFQFDEDENFIGPKENIEHHSQVLALRRGHRHHPDKQLSEEEAEFENKRVLLAMIVFQLFGQHKSKPSKLAAKFFSRLHKLGIFENLPFNTFQSVQNLNNILVSNNINLSKLNLNLKEGASVFDLTKLAENLQVILQKGYSSVYTSRFKEEFVSLEYIGRGGFGSVMKVQNNLDGAVYAVKKIPFKNDGLLVDKVLREAKALARLDHPHICRYYQAWIEPFSEETENIHGIPADTEISEELSSQNSESHNFLKDEVSNENFIPESREGIVEVFSSSSDSSGPRIIFEESKSPLSKSPNSPANSPPVNFHVSTSPTNALHHNRPIVESPPSRNGEFMQNEESVHTMSTPNESMAIVRRPSPKKSPPKFDYVLYIQMQLYGTQTLKHWLEMETRIINPQENWKIFRQIVEGIKHIHSKGIIHRDLKPANIFLSRDEVSSEMVIKIGDFGLAKELQSADFIDHSDILPEPELTSGVGTPVYASPEQLSCNQYDFKVDIYSMGIILFELFSHFGTISEKAASIRQLKQSQCPLSFMKCYPNESAVVMWLLAKDPKERPSADEILVSPLCSPLASPHVPRNFETKDSSPNGDEVVHLKKQLQESQLKIKEQEERIKVLEKLLEISNQSNKS